MNYNYDIILVKNEVFGYIMKAIKSIIRYFKRKALSMPSNKVKKISAVILAAGSSTRMEGGSKQLIKLLGKEVVLRSAEAFENCADITEIVVVCAGSEKDTINEIMTLSGISKFKCAVVGGKSRFESVKIGFEATDCSSDLVAVHDAARCLIEPEQISAVISEAKNHGAAIAACKTTDTIKTVDENGKILFTAERKHLWNAQTPQVFKRGMLEYGLYAKREEGFSPTDDAMLAETLGFGVYVVDCGSDNIKITTKKDIDTAVSILNRRNGNAKI